MVPETAPAAEAGPSAPHVASERSARASASLCKALAVFRHTCVLLARDPGTVVAYTVMSMVLLVVLRPVYQRLGTPGGSPAEQGTPGLAVMFTLLALDVAGQLLLSERTWRTWDRLRVGSVGTLAVLIGKALPLTVLFTLQQAALFLFSGVVFRFPVADGTWRLPLMGVCWGLCVSCCGLALGVWVRTQGQLAATSDIGALAVTCLSGSLVPLAVLPGWVGDVAPLTPGYWGLHGLRDAVNGDDAGYLRSLGVVLAMTAAALLLASLRSPRKAL
ncbi:ABC transporter permease [Streptomyces sp. NPDC090306]|uniref:ABC transporter permease n=1 Tax=Streptomyces sp. NPDC090306 TaxID=3365961 RepID=UPI003826E720